MLAMEVNLIRASEWHWSLFEIDRTDIESLLPFIIRLTGGKQAAGPGPGLVPCDQADWLNA